MGSERVDSTPLLRRGTVLKTFTPLLVAYLCFIFYSSLFSSSDLLVDHAVSSKSHVDQSYSLADLDAWSSSNASMFYKRDEYSCTKGTPCKTYACCGSFFGTDTGECGFGDTFCGSDCDSQCDAKPECGQYADPPGKECPLNVCCSQYGFCGSTEEFCTNGCQSNCVVDPPVPAGGSSEPVLSRVIGYYEAWAARRSCRSFPPSAIPVEGLTHVNFAFAYIDPDSLQITTMDSATPDDLFAQTTNIRSLKSGTSELQVFISIGGWTFSDNGTATQPVFPSIAADPQKQQTFADNLVSFMKKNGFDGVDLDWEYPGAPDRGGHEQADIQNYVNMLQTLRRTFQRSERGDYGLTFTIPSSYWYLRWFDVPSLSKYADWVNLMSYDLHGVWDRYNPIGAIVQGHTNLTEIKQSLNLLWRNNVAPGKVVLGLGMYGRSFTLEDASCSTPGCPFSGPAEAGPCTDSAGTLAYFEIMDIINDQKPKITHDKEAAVNYIQFGPNNDQWVSYDDPDTFAAKIEFADSIGLGGVMIWSVDQDDNDFSGLEGLVGKSLPSFEQQLKRTSEVDVNHWAGLNGQECYASDCIDSNSAPPSGFSIAPNGGPYPDTCGGGKRKFIYCPTNAMPTSCQWRGSGSCHGQCHPGEVTLAHSPHGSTSCLKPGQQAFCCVSNEWSTFTDKCGWANHCDACPSDAPYSVSSRSVYNGVFSSPCKQNFCCPYAFENCHWVGKGTCDDNECSGTDVQVGLDPEGDTGHYCAGGFSSRQKPLCCNTPKNLNPFLPVPLEDLFPTLPPATDLPAFDRQILSSDPSLSAAVNPNPNAFFFIVIDGPPDAVSNLRKRDGSHIEFITGGEHEGQDVQTAYFVCTDESDTSNCDHMHLDGLNGTIVALPEDKGFAQWAVAHSVRDTDRPVPEHLKKRVSTGTKVQALEFSYNFAKAKRDSGDIYIRIDYSDSNNYYNDIVAAKHQKRSNDRLDDRSSLQPRFWSTVSSVWKTLIQKLRNQGYSDYSQARLSADHFNVLLYGDDGSLNDCPGSEPDGFLKLSLSGSMRNTLKFGTTLVGTISPSLSLEEAYSYVNHDMYMSGQLNFDGRGNLNIGSSLSPRSLLSSPVTGFQASHPGIVSFSPNMNAEVRLLGSGQIDGKFSVNFETGSSSPMTINAPPGLGSFGGDIIDQHYVDAFEGNLGVDEATFTTLFAMDVNFETSMDIKVFGYDTSLTDASASLTARTPHVIRIVGDTGTGVPGVFDSAQQGSSEVFEVGEIMSGWSDGTTHPIGDTPSPVLVYEGNDAPASRDVPDINGYAIFGDHALMQCSNNNNGGGSELMCYWDLYANDSSLVEPDPPYKMKRGYFAYEEHELRDGEKYNLLAGRGPNSGEAGKYNVYDANGNPNGPVNAFPYETPTYPNGDNGNSLDEEIDDPSRDGERYALANPGICDDTTVTDQATIPGPAGAQVDSDHIWDRSIYPNHFMNFAQTGRLDLADGQGYRQVTNLPTFTYGRLNNNFATPYNRWVTAGTVPPGMAASDTADGLGSSSNPTVMVNLEHNLNVLKGRLFTTEGLPTEDNVFNVWLQTATRTNAEAALSAIRGVFAIFNYMNSQVPNQNIQHVTGDIQASHGTFDTSYQNTFPNQQERLRPLWTAFVGFWLTRVENFAQDYVRQRLDQLDNVWGPLNVPGNPQQALANMIQMRIQNLRNQINTLVFQNRNSIVPQ